MYYRTNGDVLGWLGWYNKYVKILVRNCLKLQLRLIREWLEKEKKNISNDFRGIYTHTFLSLCLNALPIHSKNVFWIPSHTVKGNNSFWFYTSRYISHVTVKYLLWSFMWVSEYIYGFRRMWMKTRFLYVNVWYIPSLILRLTTELNGWVNGV